MTSAWNSQHMRKVDVERLLNLKPPTIHHFSKIQSSRVEEAAALGNKTLTLKGHNSLTYRYLC